ncbi:39S ribosomal protein L40, mitochondrial [Habropoda laboriosa]|uniref:Large ribosomal subunit protein mL40 n=1 Tax=Habropoda laboriosa TaxID=597456 RepID=A0A0L7QXL9_9HYME|nr:PREDICTED: 39S ribosomal protein L40, mitochondrial isoform X2 [Habropoda laboriosa]KOC63350.1 39S ribosomal protein L40, mitochondrial [Habropoda laboriosa]
MIGVLIIANAVFRSCICSVSNLRNVSTYTHPLCFRTTETLLGEPLKKKKKLDPAIVRVREERKRRKLEKRIRVLEKHSGYMKPIFEINTLPELIEKENRSCHLTVPLSEEEIKRRYLLEREWSKYKQNQWSKNLHVIKSMTVSQEIALKELKAVSKQLYKKAVAFDNLCLPYNAVGPAHTPPINNYDSPDGEYTETTIKYPGE